MVNIHFFKRNPLVICFIAFTLFFTQLSFFPSITSAAANLALGKAITASSHNGIYAETNANDGNQASYWESTNNAFPQWIRVDLGSVNSVNQVVLKLPSGWGARTQTLSVLGSTDDVNYNTLAASTAYTFDPASNNTVTINFTGTNVRYVKVNVTANTGWVAAQLSEFEVYGTSAPSIGTGAPGDSNIEYVGRWDKSDFSNIKSYWSGAYFRVNFTGTTLSIKLASTVNMFASIDNGANIYYPNANGIVNLTPTPLSAGTHTLRITARSEYDSIQFQGLILSGGASTQPPAAKNKLIEFIGDSITAGFGLTDWAVNDYSWLTGENLNANHTQIAYSGICLQDAVPGCGDNNIGMSNQFFKLQTIQYTNSPLWDFNRYQPDQVVINLGTNDNPRGVSDATFQNTYITFLQNIRSKYPNADIFVLRTFSGVKATPTLAAVNARINAGDTKVHYVDTTGWLVSSDYPDGTHPSANANIKIANLLTPILSTPTSAAGVIPGKIEAESWTAMSGVQTEATSDTGGGSDVGWIDAGDWMDYAVNVQSAGTYTMELRVASPNAGQQVQLRTGSGAVLATVNVPNTGGWQTWTTVSANVALNAGAQTLRLYAVTTGFNVNWLNFKSSATPTPTPTPTGIPAGYTFCANENGTCSFAGTASVAYGANGTFNYGTFTTSTPCTNAVFGDPLSGLAKACYYRITTTPTPTPTPTPTATPSNYEAELATLSGGAKVNTDHVGYSGTGFVDGYWTQGAATQFNVNVATAGNYNSTLKYGNAGGGTRTLSIIVNGTKIKQTSLANLANWDTWSTQTETLALNAGNNTITYKYDTTDSGNVNLDSIILVKVAGTVDTSVKGKTIAGYQGWFSAPGDGSPQNRWVHWSGSTPGPGAVSFELYPDVREYPQTFQTGLANLGNGSPAKLFSSYNTETVNLHFKWMKDYNIDGAALQRFGVDITDPNSKSARDSITVKVKNAAEANGRIFYLMYDVSGMGANFAQAIQDDWTNTMLNTLHITSSPNYATQNGKPVVCIWGMGFEGKPGTPQEWINLINWFKNNGYYVIGGVPGGWRTGTGGSLPGFLEAYKTFNMISPWSVGGFRLDSEVDNYKSNSLIPDRDFCAANGIDYQPVAFPGFAWSNWNGGARNLIPRNQGNFFWRQAYNIKSSNISTMYIAMFDEYDEGTAIAKAAEDSSMIPTNQYFLTLDADGTHLSSDFYLRLAGAANKMLKGETPLTLTVPIPNN